MEGHPSMRRDKKHRDLLRMTIKEKLKEKYL